MIACLNSYFCFDTYFGVYWYVFDISFLNQTLCCYRRIMQEAQYDTATKFGFDGCVIISFGLTSNQEDDSTCNN